MPGIVGFISNLPDDVCGNLLNTMLNSVQHESFYNSGII